jgi:alkylation response protein AidB-like acyl-CoA dehydrogenase
MRLAFSPEQEQFRESVRNFLDRSASDAAARASMDSPDGYDPAIWSAMAHQLGIQGLTIPEEFGGSDFGQRELALVFEEIGRSLLPGPLLATVGLAVNALLFARDRTAQQRYLPGIADGSLIATMALTDGDASWGPDSLTVRARPADGGWTLTGRQDHVLWAHVAALILLVAHTPEGPTLFAVDRNAPGLEITALETVDLGSRQSALGLSGVPAVPVGEPGAGLAVFGRVVDFAAVAMAASATGGAARVLEMALEYVGTRSAFGRPIGSYQAIRHKCADLMLEVEAARSAAYYAALAAAHDSADLHIAATMAKLRCSAAFQRAAEENILIHGGIGFTWEHPAHLYYRRACSDARYLGDAAALREDLSIRLGFHPA